MSRAAFLALAFLTVAAGCQGIPDPSSTTGSTTVPATGGPCPLPAVNLSGTVTEVHASSLLVDARGRLEGPVVLHVRGGTALYLRDGLTCTPATLPQVRPGMPFEAVADGPVMESSPPQTVPDMVFFDVQD